MQITTGVRPVSFSNLLGWEKEAKYAFVSGDGTTVTQFLQSRTIHFILLADSLHQERRGTSFKAVLVAFGRRIRDAGAYWCQLGEVTCNDHLKASHGRISSTNAPCDLIDLNEESWVIIEISSTTRILILLQFLSRHLSFQ